jgi:uncharacterized repeat protein (TIGR01451 family)
VLRTLLRLLLALTLAVTALTGVSLSAGAAPAHCQGVYQSDECYIALKAQGDAPQGRAIADPGTGDPDGYLNASYFRTQAADTGFRANGFDRNFLFWAPIGFTADYALKDFSHCSTTRPVKTGPQDFCTNVAPTSTWGRIWLGESKLKYHGSGFIALVCGNFGAPTDGPIPEIVGQKFEDKNGNGTRDAGEGWMNGVVMRLYKGGVKLAETTTSGDGDYRFKLDAEADARYTAGTYTVREVVPAGYRETTPTRSVSVSYDTGYHEYEVALIGNQKLTDVQITKTSVVDPTTAGLESEWDLVVRNNGPWPAPDVTVSDTFPSDYTAITHVSHPQCSAAGLTVSCSFGTLAVGATRTVTVRSLSRPELLPVDGPIVNTARVHTSMPESDYDNNVSSDQTPLVTRAEVSVTKAADRTTYYGGELITYTIVVTNEGPSWARKVVATDDVPDRIEVLGATSSPGSTCVTSPASQGVSCDLGTMTVGQQHTITIEGRIRGAHPDDAPPTGHEHLLDVQKVERTWDLEGGTSGAFDLDCGGRGFVTDVLVRVDAVDSGTNDQVVRLGAHPTSRTSGRIVLDNTAAGRAQGHMELVCLGDETVDGNDHRHDVLAGAVRSGTHTLPADPVDPSEPDEVSTHSVVIAAGLGTHVIAPGYRVTSGTARLMESHLREYGWELVFEVPDGDVDAVVEVSYVPLEAHLGYVGASRSHPRHTHEVLFTHPEIEVTLPPGRSEHQVPCHPEDSAGLKGITATFSYPPDQSAEPVTRRFVALNPTAQPIPAVFDLLCVALEPGPDSEFHTPTNTVVVDSDTPDSDPGDDTDSVTVLVIVAAEGDTLAPAPAPAPVAVKKAVKRGRTIVARLQTETSGRATVTAMRRHSVLTATRVRVEGGQTERVRLRAKKLRRATHLTVRFGGETVRLRLR